MVARSCRKGKMVRWWSKCTKFQLYKMNTFWRSTLQHNAYSLQYCIVYLKCAKRVGTMLSIPTVTESNLALLAARQANESETRCWGKEDDFIRKAGRQRRWLTSVSKKPLSWGLDASFFYSTERGRRWGSKVKKAIRFANIPWNGQPRWGDVLIFLSCSHPQVDRVRVSPCELSRDTLV